MIFFERYNWIFYTSWDGFSLVKQGSDVIGGLVNLLPNTLLCDAANWTKFDTCEGKLFFDYRSDFHRIIKAIEELKDPPGHTFIFINRIDPDFLPKLDFLFKKDVYGKVKWVFTLNIRRTSLKDNLLKTEEDCLKILPPLVSEVGIKSGKKFFHIGQGIESYLWSKNGETNEYIYLRDLPAHVRDYKISLVID